VSMNPQLKAMTTLNLDLHSSGQTVTVTPGDRLEIRLEENPTTGFRWCVEGDKTGVLNLEHDAFIHPVSRISGAGGTRKFIFIVAKQGHAMLRVSYRRSWEKRKPPQATFELTVTAK
jgi:inhibitor of cysteine peptidase